MSTPTRTTLRAIAERTGITRMAVSLALRGKVGVSKETRARVLKVAEELGYQPDPEVAKLMVQIRSRAAAETKSCLALLTSGARPQEWKRFLTERKYVEGASERARQYGYRLEEFWLNNPAVPARRLRNILWSRGIEGVIIAPLQERLSPGHVRTVPVDLGPFSTVEISETVETPDLDRAIHDQFTSMVTVITELRALGYRRIGLVIEEALDLRVNGKWSAAYLRARLGPAGGDIPAPLILPALDQEAFDQWYDANRPECIVSVDRFAMRLIQGRKLSVPGDVAYASLDLDGDLPEYPDLSGIDQNSHLVGATAVDMVVAAIHRGHHGIPEHPVRTNVEGSWRLGKSTPRRRGRAR